MAEEIVPTDVIRRQPEMTIVPGLRVNAVVRAPFGAHPTSMYRAYDHDEAQLRLWVGKARSEAGVAEYLQEYVFGVKDHFEYLDRVGGFRMMSAIKADPLLGYARDLHARE